VQESANQSMNYTKEHLTYQKTQLSGSGGEVSKSDPKIEKNSFGA
jgi:hypothetical protein